MNKVMLVGNYKKQKGFMALFVTIMLLVGISLVVIFTSNTVSLEQKIGANQIREKQAYENAVLGLDYFIAFAKSPNSRKFFSRFYSAAVDDEINVFQSDTIWVDENTQRTTLAQFILDVAELSNIDSTDTALPAPVSETVRVTVVNNVGEDLELRVTSTGTSDDGTASRSVSKLKLLKAPLGDSPGFSLIARSTVDVTGSGELQNLYFDDNIWSGNVVSNAGSAESYIATPNVIANVSTGDLNDGASPTPNDIQADDTTNRQQASDGSNIGIDVIDEDSNLNALLPSSVINDAICDAGGMTFFSNFFNGLCPSDIKAMVDLEVDDDTDNLSNKFDATYGAGNPPQDSMIWVNDSGDDGIRLTSSDSKVYGCTVAYIPSSSSCKGAGGVVDPVVLILDGDGRLTGGVDIHGLLYIKGDWTLGDGTVNVYGSVIVEGTVSGAGTFNIYYDPNAVLPNEFKPSNADRVNTQKDWL